MQETPVQQCWVRISASRHSSTITSQIRDRRCGQLGWVIPCSAPQTDKPKWARELMTTNPAASWSLVLGAVTRPSPSYEYEFWSFLITRQKTVWWFHWYRICPTLWIAAFVIESLSHVQHFVTPWTEAHQASLSFTISGACSNSCLLSRWCHPTIPPSLLSPSPSAFYLSQLQGLF